MAGRFVLALAATVASALAACQRSSASGSDAAPDSGLVDSGGADGGAEPADAGGGQGRIQTVFLILMENHNWSDIKGSASAPYINGTLLPAAASCDNYYDNPKAVHPSEPNYLWLEAGDNLGVTDDADPAVNHRATAAHLVTLLSAAGVSWRAYAEDVPAGTCPIASTGLFAPKHTPMLFFDDVVGNPPSASAPTCIEHLRPYSQLEADLAADTVARYNFITPDLCHDMHDNTGCATRDAVRNGDDWLRAEVPKILGSQAYQSGGAIFVTWDESEGGEHPIGMLVLSPKARAGYTSPVRYYHSSMLRTVEEIFGVTPLLGDAAHWPGLGDLFTSYP